MDPTFLAAMAALGLASGVHCAGMCGGIVTAFSIRGQGRNYSVSSASRIITTLTPNLLFNAGRVSTYALAGAFAGSLGWYASGGQTALLVLANVVLVFVGLHLAGVRSPIRWLESLGAPLWRRIQPSATRFMRSGNSYLAGLLWGWLPCGLVYGALTAAAFAGSPVAGAAAMLAFGIGTLPGCSQQAWPPRSCADGWEGRLSGSPSAGRYWGSVPGGLPMRARCLSVLRRQS